MKSNAFLKTLAKSHGEEQEWPSPKVVKEFLDQLLGVLFPGFGVHIPPTVEAIERELEKSFERLERCLFPTTLPQGVSVENIVATLRERLPLIYAVLLKDAKAIENGDPAATTLTEVIRSYPGFLAIASYRIAHELLQLGVSFVPRIITELAHSNTGIDIHPGATIGESFFIDHGTGVVIGETTTIGNHVKLYQGVTLGALSVQKKMAATKRHPTIEDQVVIYAGATILGGETVIGKNSVIGGNAWITSSIAEGSQVYHTPAITIKNRKNNVTID